MITLSLTRRRARRIAAAACLVFLFGMLAGCGDEGDDAGGIVQTGAALEYDVVIAICEERLSGTDDTCARVTSSTSEVIYAHALFGRAQGRQVQIRVEGPLGTEDPPVATVPEDRMWLEGLEIFRDRACPSLPCELVVRAYVDGQEAASETFTFIEP